jgi:hypothetical protein
MWTDTIDIQWAVIAVLVLVVLFLFWNTRGGKREGFVSKEARELTSNARQFFDGGGDATSYSKFKTRVPGADPVKFNDTRKLWKEGRLTPEEVQKTGL